MSKRYVVLEPKGESPRECPVGFFGGMVTPPSVGLVKQAVRKVRILEKTEQEKGKKGARLRAVKAVKSKRLSAKRQGLVSVVKCLLYASYVSQS